MNDRTLPTIGSWGVRVVKVPMREPHRTASGVIAESPLDTQPGSGIEWDEAAVEHSRA